MDLGATKIRIGVVDEAGKILRMVQLDTEKARPRDLVKALEELGAGRVGVGVAGYRTGEGFKAPNMDLRRFLPSLKGYNPIMHNDAVLGAFAIRELFDMPDNFVYLAFGTGIGAGVYVDGRLVGGRYGNAHEVGHIVVDFQGRLKCACGGKGHWEAYCSGSGMPRFYSFLAREVGTSKRAVDARYIFEARDDPLARKVLDECIRMNASGLATIIHLYDPERIVIGGGLGLDRWDEYIKPSIEILGEYSAFEPPEIVKSPLREATLVGAALAVMKGGIP